MYIDKNYNVSIVYEIHFKYFTNKEFKNNLNSQLWKCSNLDEVKKQLQILLEDKKLKDVSRVFIYKYLGQRKTWSKVITVNIGDRVTPDFLKFIGV